MFNLYPAFLCAKSYSLVRVFLQENPLQLFVIWEKSKLQRIRKNTTVYCI